MRNAQPHEFALILTTIQIFLPDRLSSEISPDLERFGCEVLSKDVFSYVASAEKTPPYLSGSGYDAFGHRTNHLVTSEGWKKLLNIGHQEGIVAIAYENEHGEYSRVVQLLK